MPCAFAGRHGGTSAAGNFEGDKMASGDSLCGLLLGIDERYTSILQSSSGQFRTFRSKCDGRAQQTGQNRWSWAEAGLWNSILIVKMPKPIRFHTGNPINWCQNCGRTEQNHRSGACSISGTGCAVDRAFAWRPGTDEAWGNKQDLALILSAGKKSWITTTRREPRLGFAINGTLKVRLDRPWRLQTVHRLWRDYGLIPPSSCRPNP